MSSAGKTQIVVNTAAVADGDSIASYLADGSGNFLTSQTIAAVRRLDVNTASEFAEDTAHASGDYGTFVMAVRNDAGTPFGADGDYVPFSITAAGALRVDAGTITANIEGDYPEDSAHVSGDRGLFTLGVRNDANTALTSTDGDYSPFAVDSAGRIKNVFSGQYAEDAAHVSGDTGLFALGVRQDTTAATAGTTGDYSGIQTWSNGELKTADIINLANLQQILDVGTTAVALPTTPLANRKLLFVQNQGSNNVYLGSATVTNTGATRGFLIGKGGYVTVEAGPANAVYAIASSAATDNVSIWEHS